MKIDSAIKTFSESYDKEAMESIDALSKDYGLNINGLKFKAFNMNESFEGFEKSIMAYAACESKYQDDPDGIQHRAICDHINEYIESGMIQESEIPYHDIPNFIQSYVSGIKSLTEKVDDAKLMMMENDVNPDYIGTINEFCDAFITKIDQKFENTMTKLLWESGYNSRKMLSEINTQKKESAVFL